MALDFEAVFNRSPAPTMILNRKLEFVAANEAYYVATGTSPETLIGRYVFDVFPEVEERVEDMKRVFETAFSGEPVVLEETPFRIHFEGRIEERFWTIRHALVKGRDGEGDHMIQFSEDVTEKVRIREMRDALTGELQHRIGNTFSIVGALARQTGRKATDVADFLTRFEERLASLVSVNRQLSHDTAASDSTIAWVVDQQLKTHAQEAVERISVKGPDYSLSMRQSQAISMAIYELATNSLKYGAIGQPSGRIDVSWEHLPEGGCRLRWRETGIEGKERPEKTGYGTLLLTSIIPSQVGGQARREIGPDFFDYHLEIAGAA